VSGTAQMSDPKPTASLSPSLLARKGGAKPAMRPQIGPLHQFHEAAARDMSDDLGWNDLGEDSAPAETHGHQAQETGEVIAINGDVATPDAVPEIVQQREKLEHDINAATAKRPAALARGRRAAFTLRLDADRHLRLRLASTVLNRSAQQVVTEALDQFLETMPEIEALAARVRKSR